MLSLANLDRRTLHLFWIAAAAAMLLGVAAAAAMTPLLPAAALAGLALLGLIWWRPFAGIGLLVAIIASLPFGVVPLPLAGAQLTFVDVILIATFSSVLIRVAFGQLRLPIDAPSVALLAFVVVAIAAFIAGASLSPAPPELIRRFGKFLVSLLLFLVARSLLVDRSRLTRLARWLMVAGAVQGAVGALLMALSPATQLTLLSRLQVIGYPTTDVLRYVPGPNNTYTTQLRAIGTSVDPNVFGGTLMLALALQVVQLVSPRPILPRPTLLVLVLATAAGVVLSLSRASWLGLAIGLLVIAVLRLRRILLLAAVAGALLLVTPPGQALVARFIGGFSTSDPATAFRVGEYANALTLIGRYPLLGIGFGLSPDIDVTAGVSSVYLLVGEQTGLLGLLVYGTALASVWRLGLGAVRAGAAAGARPAARAGARRDARADVQRGAKADRHGGAVADLQGLQGLRAAFLAALAAALVAGLLDHYFANYVFPHAVALFWLYAAGLAAAARPATDQLNRTL